MNSQLQLLFFKVFRCKKYSKNIFKILITRNWLGTIPKLRNVVGGVGGSSQILRITYVKGGMGGRGGHYVTLGGVLGGCRRRRKIWRFHGMFKAENVSKVHSGTYCICKNTSHIPQKFPPAAGHNYININPLQFLNTILRKVRGITERRVNTPRCFIYCIVPDTTHTRISQKLTVIHHVLPPPSWKSGFLCKKEEENS